MSPTSPCHQFRTRFLMPKTYESDSIQSLFDQFNITFTNNFTVICNEKFNPSENITVTYFTPDLSCRNSYLYTVSDKARISISTQKKNHLMERRG